MYDNVEYLSSLGKAQTANVKRDAAVGVAQANRDAGIRVRICRRLAEGEKYQVQSLHGPFSFLPPSLNRLLTVCRLDYFFFLFSHTQKEVQQSLYKERHDEHKRHLCVASSFHASYILFSSSFFLFTRVGRVSSSVHQLRGEKEILNKIILPCSQLSGNGPASVARWVDASIIIIIVCCTP